jgi:uncharacterized membrane protein
VNWASRLMRLDDWRICFVLFLVVCLVSVLIQEPVLSGGAGTDLEFIRWASTQIANKNNPYALMEDWPLDKVRPSPNYTPLTYIVGSAIQLMAKTPSEWVYWYRTFVMVSSLGVGLMIFLISMSYRQPLIGLFGALFWALNRFNLQVLSEGNADNTTVFLILFSLLLFDRKPGLSCLLLGAAISFKPFPAILAPIYFILLKRRLGLMRACALVLLVPALVCLPFLIWNPSAFAKSMLWNAVRPQSAVSSAWGWSPLLDLTGDFGLLSRIPILSLLAFLYFLVYHDRLSLPVATLMGFLIFLSTNVYIYSRYFSWIMPLFPVVMAEFLHDNIPSSKVTEKSPYTWEGRQDI